MSELMPMIGQTQDAGLTADEVLLVQKMQRKLSDKRAKNMVRQQYYDQKIGLKDLGISTPPELRSINSVLGWAAKTVDVLADRISFEKFVAPGEDEDAFGLNQMVAENDFREAFAQTSSSALTHSCAFITITQGDTSKGEPEILWLPKSAHWATGIWDKRTRALKAGLSITKCDEDAPGALTPKEMTLYLPDKTVVMTAVNGGWALETIPNPTGRPLIVPVVVAADLRRPFGRSRISRAVMSLTDAAIRTIVRSEIGAEFYASPQRYLLGADEDALTGSKWSAVVSKLLTISRDEEGQIPTIGQFNQMSMQPHTDQLRQWASLLAAESQIPIDELGFPSDNPSSDSAIQSQRDPLRLAANRTIRGYKSVLHRLAVTSVMLREGVSDPAEIDGLNSVEAWFAPTVHTSDAAAADAVLKQVQVMPWLAESPVILEKLGYDSLAVERLLADKRRAEGNKAIEELLASRAAPAQQPAAPPQQEPPTQDGEQPPQEEGETAPEPAQEDAAGVQGKPALKKV